MSVPLYKQIYKELLERIKKGEFASDNRIPSEKELAESFNVSRITSRKALDMLAEKNIIKRIRGKGSFLTNVIPVDEEKNEDQQDNQNPNEGIRLIGLVIPDLSEDFGLTFVKAIEKECSRRNINLIFKQSYGILEEEAKSIESLVELGVDGLVIMPVHGQHYNNTILQLVVNDFPLVLTDRFLKGIPASSVGTDNSLASRKLTDYLFDLGHKNISFISSPPDGTSTVEDRLNGFQVAFSHRGPKLNPDYILTSLKTPVPIYKHTEEIEKVKEEDMKVIKHFVSKHPELTAFVVSEYGIAELLTIVIRDMGKRIPEDYSIVCFDTLRNNLADIRFTHIQQDEEKIAEKAVELLLQKIKGDNEPHHVFAEFSLVEGNSTKSMNVI